MIIILIISLILFALLVGSPIVVSYLNFRKLLKFDCAVLDDEKTAEINLSAIIEYLEYYDFVKSDEIGDFDVYSVKGIDGYVRDGTIRILVPKSDSRHDYGLRVREIIRRLAEYQNSSQIKILYDLL